MTTPQATIQLAVSHHQAGNLKEAESLYRQLLAQDPANSDAIQLLGVLMLQSGQSAAGLQLIQRAIAINPSVPDYYGNLGMAFNSLGRPDEAHAAYQRAIELRPDYPEAWNNLANLFRNRGDHEQAVTLFQKALAIRPDYAEAMGNMANSLRDLGRTDEAEDFYRRALVLRPDMPVNHCNLANAMCDRNQFEQAIALYREAIRLDPRLPEAHLNLANALREVGRITESLAEHQTSLNLGPESPDAWFAFAYTLRKAGQLDQAIAAGRMVIKYRPNFADGYSNLSAGLQEKGLIDEAIEASRRAIALAPNLAGAYLNLGNALKDKGRLAESIVAYRRALDIKPDYAEALTCFAHACKDAGQFEIAVAACEHALTLRPDLAEIHNNLAIVLKDQGRIAEALAAFDRAIELKPGPVMYSNRIYTTHFLAEIDPPDLARRHFSWDERFAYRGPIAAHQNDRNPDRPLRIAYVSADFRMHSVAFFLYPLLKSHDRRRYQIACYPTSAREDSVTGTMRQCVDRWQSLMGFSDEEADQLIRRDRIDILVDLTGHTSGTRLTLFARKPAPVQVTWLGYPNTTGLKAIDWRLTDAIADPPGSEPLYSEGLFRLPHTAWCFFPLSGSPPVGPVPSIKAGRITFASFNDMAKVNPMLLRTWAQILNQVPNSRLILKNRGVSAASLRPRVQELLATAGIAPDRVDFLPRQPQPSEHLKCYDAVDIALDTFPYHGTTTTCEALWMGVPVISHVGQSHVSRVGASLLTTIGLPDLIARDEAEYIQIAVSLARDAGRLADLRTGLRRTMQNSKLMDAPSMARDLESAYRRMWQNWLETK